MTKENYISYLSGTIVAYPTRSKQYLKKSFIMHRVANEDRQTYISDEFSVPLDISDGELNDQILQCITNETARKIFENWEYTKDYKYSVLFEAENFGEMLDKAQSFTTAIESDESERSDKADILPLYKRIEDLIFLKFCSYYSGIDLATNTEVLAKYPYLIVFHLDEQIVEFRFDSIRRLVVSDRQFESFYTNIVNQLSTFCNEKLNANLKPLDLEFLQKAHPNATLMAKYMSLPSGGNAQLDVGKNQKYILPIIGELHEIMQSHEDDLKSAPALKEALEQFMFENEELSDCTWVAIMWEDEIKTRSIRVKFVFNYKNHPYCLLQHYANSVLVGMERMNHVVKYIKQHKNDPQPTATAE